MFKAWITWCGPAAFLTAACVGSLPATDAGEGDRDASLDAASADAGARDAATVGRDASPSDASNEGDAEGRTDAGVTPAPEGDFLYVAVGDQGLVQTSCDGESWTSVAEAAAVSGGALLRGVGYGNGRFVAVGGEDRTRVMLHSDDGVRWQREDQSALCSAAPERCDGQGVCTDCDWVGDAAWLDDGEGGLWVAGGGNGHRLWSRDGAVWQPFGDVPFDGTQYRRFTNAGSRVVAAGNQVLAVVSLRPAQNPPLEWTTTTLTSGESWRLTHGGEVSVAVQGDLCRTYAAGAGWQSCTLPAGAPSLVFAGFLHGRFYIGDPNSSLASDDGAQFSLAGNGSDNRNVVTGPDRMVGWRQWSSDGATWHAAAQPASDPRDVAGGRIAGSCP